MFKKLLNKNVLLISLLLVFLVLFLAIPSSFAEDSSTMDIADISSFADDSDAVSYVDSYNLKFSSNDEYINLKSASSGGDVNLKNTSNDASNEDIGSLNEDIKETGENALYKEKKDLTSNKLSEGSSWTIEETGASFSDLKTAVNSAYSGYTIVGSNVLGENIGNITIDKDLTIKANRLGDVVFKSTNARIFNLTSGHSLSLINLEFKDYYINSRMDGGIVNSEGTLYIENCNFTNVRAPSSYGALIYHGVGGLTIKNSYFEGINSNAAAIYAHTSLDLNIENTTFKKMTSTYNAGSIYAFASNLTINNCSFIDSSTAQSQIYSQNNVFTVNNTVFRNLTASSSSAAIETGSTNIRVLIDNSVFDSCKSTMSVDYSNRFAAGAIDSSSKNTTIHGTLFKNCTTTAVFSESSYSYKATAGAIMMDAGEVKYCVFLENSNAESNPAKFSDIMAFEPIDADYNYWGSNSGPNSDMVNENVSANNWYLLTMDIDGEVYAGIEKEIGFKLNQINDTEGHIASAAQLKDINLTVDYTLSGLESSPLAIVDGTSSINYISEDFGDETLTVRPVGEKFEFYVSANPYSSIYVAKNGSNSNPGTFEDPYQTIQYAISQVSSSRNIIYIKSGKYEEHDLEINKDLNIVAIGEVEIDAGKNGRIFIVNDGINLAVRDMALLNGQSDGDGGAIYLGNANLTLNNVSIKDSSANNGGALYLLGEIYIVDCEFRNNTALNDGGAVYMANNLENIVLSSGFFNNTAGNDGGAIFYSSEASSSLGNKYALAVSSSRFENNTAGNDGGGVFIADSNGFKFNLEENTFRTNNGLNGAGIYMKSNSYANVSSIKDNIFVRNRAGNFGGSIFLANLTVNLLNNDMGANTALDGNRIYVDNAKFNANMSFLNGEIVSYTLSSTLILNATVSDEHGNPVSGGYVEFYVDDTSYGSHLVKEGIASCEFSLDDSEGNELIVSGNYSSGDSNTVIVNGTIHPVLKYWFIEGGKAYEYLADAVMDAKNGDVIYGRPGSFVTDMININKNLTIKAPVKGTIFIEGNSSKIFNITKFGISVNLINLTLSHGANTGNGGLIEARGTLNIINCTLKDNAISKSNSQGGAIYMWNGSALNVESSMFKNISCNYRGGAICIPYLDSKLNVIDSSFNRITGGGNGSVIFSSGETFINGSNFTNIEGPDYDTYTNYYAAVYAYGNLTIDNSRFVNIVGQRASAVYQAGPDSVLNISHSVFANNFAVNTTVMSYGIENIINYCIFVNNTAYGNYWDVITNGVDSVSNDFEFNYWDSNDKPVYNFNDADVNAWVILELSVDDDVLIAGTSNEIKVDLSRYSDANGFHDLEGYMPAYLFDLTANLGDIDSKVLVENNHGIADYLAPNENVHVIVTIEPGYETLEFDVIKTESLIFVSNAGSDISGDGSLARPYKTISFALTKVNEQKNIVYLASGIYNEHNLNINRTVTLQGQKADGVIINGQNQSSILNVNAPEGNVEIKAVSLMNGKGEKGGAINVEKAYNFIMYNSVISSSSAVNGGAIYLDAFAKLYNNKFIDIAEESNAAIYLNAGNLNLTNNTMTNVPENAIYVKNGLINAKITYLGNKTVEVPKLTATVLNATVTDDVGNPISGGLLEFRYSGGLIGTSPVDTGKASVEYSTPNKEIIYSISGFYSNANDEAIIKTGNLRIIKLAFFINETGYETLAQAIKASLSGDVILAVPGTYIVDYQLIDKDLTIKANESGSVVLHVYDRRFLDVYGEYTLNLEGLIMEDAKGYHGFFVYNEFGIVNIDNCTFRDSALETTFAVVTSENGILNINNSRFENLRLSDASTSDYGGAVYGYNSQVTVRNSEFINNKAGSYGGAICAYWDTILTVINSTFNNNSADFRGGAIYSGMLSNITVINSSFINNSALGYTSSYGGALCIESNSLNLTGSVFMDNVVTARGGAVYTAKNSTINNNIFLNNINTNSDIGNDVYFYWFDTSYPYEFVDANYNYWGTNNGPNSSNIACPIEGASVFTDKWVILDVSINSTNVTIGPNYAISLDMSHYVHDGEKFALPTPMPDLDIDISSLIGIVRPNSTTVVDGLAAVIYYPLDVGDELIKFTNSNQELRFKVEFGADYFLSANITSADLDLEESCPVNVSILNNFRDLTFDLDNQKVIVNAKEIVNNSVSALFSLSAKTIKNGFFSFDLNEFDGLKAGSSYEISFALEDESFDVESSIIKLNINKKATNLNVSDLDMKVGDGSLTLTLKSGSIPLDSKEIIVSFDGKNTTIKTNSEGIAVFDLSNALSGKYDVDVFFMGDGEYAPSNDSAKIDISKYTTLIESDNVNETVGKGTLNINLTFDGKAVQFKDITVIISNINGTELILNKSIQTNDLGFASIDLEDFEIGEYVADILFAGDDKFESSNKQVNISIYELVVSLYAEDKTVEQGSGSLDIFFTVNGRPIQGKLINIEIAEFSELRITNSEGIVSADLSSLTPGEYLVIFSFSGDNEYPSCLSSATVFVLESTVPSNDTNGTNGTGDNGTNGTGGNGTDENIRDGKVLQELIDNAAPGSIVDLGNYVYENVSDIKVNKSISLKGDNTTIISKGPGSTIFVLGAVSGGLEDFNISGINFKLNNGDTLVLAKAENGSSPLSIDSPAIMISDNIITCADDDVVAESINVLELDSERGVLAPTRPISINSNTLDSGINPFKFVATGLYNSSEANIGENGNIPEKKSTVIVYQDMVTTAFNSKTDGRIGKYFNIVLTDGNGNPLANKKVQIGFNGVVYNRTTNESGGARLQINLASEDVYTFAMAFLGDDNYNASFEVAKITVNKQKAKLTTANKLYKASAKTKSITATFKTAAGNPINSKKVSFTVNGKTYTATTNAKGVATVNVSLSKKGTYSFTAKYAGDKTYAAISTTAKLTIK